MPVHTSAASVGVAKLSNGQALTELDRRANAQADVLAKKAVEEHRVPEKIRERMAQQLQLGIQTVKWIGRATHLANNFPEDPHRDTSTTKAATAASRRARAAAAAARRENLAPKPPPVE